MNVPRKNVCWKPALAGLVLSAAVIMPPVLVKAADENDSAGVSGPEVIFPPSLRATAPADLPIPTDTQTIFFTPQDENTSATVLFLVNKTNTRQVVKLTTFRLDGTVFIRTRIPIPAKNLVRIVSDTVDTVSGSWQDAILANFTTSSTYGRLIVPKGVFVEGYVAWNGGSTFDPLSEVPTLPLRFWTR